jgi:prophage regulatory protein
MAMETRRKLNASRAQPAPGMTKETVSSGPNELLLLNEVTARTRLSDTTLWRLEKADRFPKRIKIGFKRVAWRKAEIDTWIAGDAAGARRSQPVTNGSNERRDQAAASENEEARQP